MYLKSLELINFKRHAKLNIGFSDKLNILHGDNNCGKTCVISAIKWLFFGEGKDIRKEGTKKSVVTATLDSGIIIRKIRSASINAYELEIDGEVKRFDACGKGIPDEVKEALGTRQIEIDGEEIILNIADQDASSFLLGASPSFRSHLFNKLVGSSLIDKTLQSFNKDILKISRESKLEQEHLEEQKTSLSEVTIQKDKLEKLYGDFKIQVDNLKALYERYDKIVNLIGQSKTIDNNLLEVSNALKEIKTIPDELLVDLKNEINKLNNYNQLLLAIKNNDSELEKTNKELKGLKIVNIDIEELQCNVNKLERIKELRSQLVGNEQNINKIINKLEEIKEKIIEGELKQKEIRAQIKICPTCGQEIK